MKPFLLLLKVPQSFVSINFVTCSIIWVTYDAKPRELQHPRLPCPSPTPGVYPNPCPLSQWCCPTISSSVVPFSSCFQSFPASGSFQMSQLFTSAGQKYWSFSFSISPSNEHLGLISFTMDWLDLLVAQGQGLHKCDKSPSGDLACLSPIN